MGINPLRSSNFNIKIVIIAIVVLIMAVIAISMVFKNKENHDSQPTDEVIEIYSEKIVVSTKDYINKTSDFDVEMKIPQFENLKSSFKSTINNRIEADLNYQNVFNAVSMGIEDKSSIGKFKYYVTYDRYNCYDYISLIVHQSIQLRRRKTNAERENICY